jgi:hypothetical protein
MTRPANITIVATIVLVGGSLAVIAGAFALNDPKQNRHISLIVLLIGVFGLATSIGVFHLQRWARLSVLSFVGLTAYLFASFAPVILFIQIPPRPGVPELTEGKRAIVLMLCLLLVAVGLWSARVLTTKPTRELFGIPLALQPLSITVIGWYLVISGITNVGGLRTWNSPTMSFGFVFSGWSAGVVRLLYTAVQFSIGTALLRRKEQSRRFVIYYSIFEVLNFAVFYFRSDREANLVSFHNARVLYNPASAAHLPASVLSSFMRFASIEWCVLTLIGLSFLATQKNEFAATFEKQCSPTDTNSR